eukprot:TRINITY_DN17026_c0_g2_i1.p1 TRINITY_DN17026_c0_g2~~TRINITY_DN17026_c0_g2_i1.p1  ORF type:complete len:607 (-),score=83.33 TRINITY_DN17026_c0_g2_i1:96-1802(-)
MSTSLAGLATAQLPLEEKVRHVSMVLRGCREGPVPQQRLLAATYAPSLLLPTDRLQHQEALLDAAAAAEDAGISEMHEIKHLAARTPLPLDGFLSALGGDAGAAVRNLKPFDVLAAAELRPAGIPRSAHAFVQALNERRGPLYRCDQYVRIQKQEREHFPWVAERVRVLAPKFFRQFCLHEEKQGMSNRQLVRESDLFLTFVIEKLLALLILNQLPSLLRRQLAQDAAGSVTHRWRFVRDFRWAPPPLAAVAAAFGIDARARPHGAQFDRSALIWQREYLWNRKRVPHWPEGLLPSVEQLGRMAVASPLKHRPFASLLGELHAHEDALLRPWYTRAAPTEPVLHVLWSAELVQQLSIYVVQVLRSYGSLAGGSRHPTVLCLGSGAGRLRHCLEHVLSRLQGVGVRVVAAVPTPSGALQEDEDEGYRVRQGSALPGAAQSLPSPAEGNLTLEKTLDLYSPTVVICACMPTRTDWSQAMRRCPSVLEYLLVGPADSDRSGDRLLTWGQPEAFLSNRDERQAAPHARDGFFRKELVDLSKLCLGTEDAPGRAGANVVVSFRRFQRQRLSYS